MDEAMHYQLMLELQQWEEEEIDRINLELNTIVSEDLLTYEMEEANMMLQTYNN